MRTFTSCAGDYENVVVVSSFMCQLDLAMGFSDIWSSIILGVPVNVFLDEINIQISRLSEIDYPPLGWL